MRLVRPVNAIISRLDVLGTTDHNIDLLTIPAIHVGRICYVKTFCEHDRLLRSLCLPPKTSETVVDAKDP